ncbi:hypothetical protein NMY22_g15116 [Coprinellus aureogranulatus]|nr:hypothetical protein NMY22_g15116 [Coprinellus aureogranulatus]
MTDYASQGKTRTHNVVELSQSKNFQAIYTALSRSSTAENTFVVGGINETQWVRREVAKTADEKMRNPLIKRYVGMCKEKGLNFTEEWHPAIRLEDINDLIAKPPCEAQIDPLWDSKVARKTLQEGQDILEGKRTRSKKSAKGEKAKPRDANGTKPKRALADQTPGSEEQAPKRPMSTPMNLGIETPKGIVWDGINYSCAYDAIIVILYNLWSADVGFWTSAFVSMGSEIVNEMKQGFMRVANGTTSLERARDDVRALLHRTNPVAFPLRSSWSPEQYLSLQGVTTLLVNRFRQQQCGGTCTVQDALYINPVGVRGRCSVCDEQMVRQMNVTGVPPELLTFSLELAPDLVPNLTLVLGNSTYRLRGLVYGGRNHFTCRLIDKHGQVWYADGMASPGQVAFEKVVTLQDDLKWMRSADDRKLLYLLYANETKRCAFDDARTARSRRIRLRLPTPKRVNMPDTPETDSGLTFTRSDRYYFDVVVFEVEGTLYRVLKDWFTKWSNSLFSDMFSLPQSRAGSREGASDENPIRLVGCTKAEFESLLELMSPRRLPYALDSDGPESSPPALTKEQWIGVLKLGRLWDMPKAAALAIEKLEAPKLSPTEQVLLGKTYGVPTWLKTGYTALVRRLSGDMTLEEAQKAFERNRDIKGVWVRKEELSCSWCWKTNGTLMQHGGEDDTKCHLCQRPLSDIHSVTVVDRPYTYLVRGIEVPVEADPSYERESDVFDQKVEEIFGEEIEDARRRNSCH